MPTRQEAVAKYGRKAKQRWNRAIRAEVPGGPETLDLLEKVSHMRNVYIDIEPEEEKRLRIIEDGLQAIRTKMVAAIQELYSDSE